MNRLSVWGKNSEERKGKTGGEPFRLSLSPVPRSTKGLFTGYQIVGFPGEIVSYQKLFCVVALPANSVQPGNDENKQNKNSERAAHSLTDFVAVIAQLTLSKLIGMAMRSSLKSQKSLLHQWRSSRPRFRWKYRYRGSVYGDPFLFNWVIFNLSITWALRYANVSISRLRRKAPDIKTTTVVDRSRSAMCLFCTFHRSHRTFVFMWTLMFQISTNFETEVYELSMLFDSSKLTRSLVSLTIF